MTLQTQSLRNDQPVSSESEELADDSNNAKIKDTDTGIDREQVYRASAYSLIAALLRDSPDQKLLDLVEGLSQGQMRDNEGDELLRAMYALALSAKTLTPDSIKDEFHSVFIGLGKGEVVPYGSWYLTGFLMEKPLSELRDDLARLGYERNESVTEPEDHAAALCEVISLMISSCTDIAEQSRFFESHMTAWISRFLEDLTQARSAVFYRAVGRFGLAFMALEKQYYAMQV